MKFDKLIKRIIKNSGVVLLGNSTASMLNLISFTIVAKQLGPKYLAILVLAQTYAVIFNDILNIQTWESMIKFGSGSFEYCKTKNVIKTNLFLDIISATAATVVAMLLVRPTVYMLGWDVSNLNIFYFYSVTILCNITTLTIGIPRLFDQYLSVAKIQVSIAFLKLAAILVAFVFGNSFIVFIYIYLACDIAMSLSLIIFSANLLNAKYGNSWWKVKLELNSDQIRFIWWTNLRTIIRIPVRYFDMIVISSVISLQLVGVYKVYKEIAGFVSRVGEPVNQTIFPEFTKLIGKNDIEKATMVVKKSILLMFAVGSLITIFLILSSNIIVTKFFGEKYLSNIDVLYYMIGLFGVSFVTVPINSLFIAAGFAKYSFLVILFSNIIYLVAVFVLGKYIGIYGIVLAYAIQLILNKGTKIILLRKYHSSWGDSR